MYSDKFYQRFTLKEELVQEAGLNPFYRHVQSGLDDPMQIDEGKFINLAANNYLGLANDERIKIAVIEAVKRYGASLCGTPIATGYSDLYQRVEKKLAGFIGVEDAVILPSGYQANNGLFSSTARKEDLIIFDHFVHSSLLQGIKSARCKIRPFLHNDVGHLQGILAKSGNYQQVFVVTESVFSTEGSIAPFKEIVAVCSHYNALPVVDDSHGIGVIGKSGKGILESKQITDYQGIYTASLGKALANAGGMIAGKKKIIEYLRYHCSHLIYSTALTPGVLGGIEKALDIIVAEFPLLSSKMWCYQKRIRSSLLKAGFSLCPAEAPINSVIAGKSVDTIILSKKFYDRNIFTTPFIAPSVPVNEGRVRLIAGANLKDETIETVIRCIEEMA